MDCTRGEREDGAVATSDCSSGASTCDRPGQIVVIVSPGDRDRSSLPIHEEISVNVTANFSPSRFRLALTRSLLHPPAPVAVRHCRRHGQRTSPTSLPRTGGSATENCHADSLLKHARRHLTVRLAKFVTRSAPDTLANAVSRQLVAMLSDVTATTTTMSGRIRLRSAYPPPLCLPQLPTPTRCTRPHTSTRRQHARAHQSLQGRRS